MNKIVLGLATSAVVATGVGVAYQGMQPDPLAVACNNGVVVSCEEALDSGNFNTIAADLNENGLKVIEVIEAERLDESLRAGENLEAGYARFINSKNELEPDMKITVVTMAQIDSVQTRVRWIDGVEVTYYLRSDGTGYWYQDGVTREQDTTLNWEYVGNNVKITSGTGNVTFLGGQAASVKKRVAQAVARAERFAVEQEARMAQEREDMIRREQAVENTIRGIFSPFHF